LQRYEAHGVRDLEDAKVFYLEPLASIGTPFELNRMVGGGLQAQLDMVQQWLYA
jgi:hypothetical protein